MLQWSLELVDDSRVSCAIVAVSANGDDLSL